MIKKVLRHVAILLLYTFLICLLLYPLPVNLSTGLLEAQSGDPLLQIWVVQWNIHKLTTPSTWLRTGSLSQYFDANIFYPYSNTFAYHDHIFALGLIGLPIYVISQNPIITYNVLLLLSFILSAYGMYLLCREITRNEYAAFLAGLIFGLLPYRFAHLDHLNLLSIQWLPLCLLFLTRYLFSKLETTPIRTSWRNISTITLFWGFFLLQVLTSFNYLFMLLFAVGIYIVTLLGVQTLVCRKLKFALLSKQKFALLILGGCITGLILLPFIFPYLKANWEMGFQRTLAEAESLSARIQDYLVAPENNVLYGQFTRTFQSPNSRFPREQMLFNGIFPMVLAIWGIFGVRGKEKNLSSTKILRFSFIILLIIAGILSLGPSITLFGKTLPLPYLWLYHYVPGFKSMRVPARFGLLVSFSLAVLAAIGLSQMYEYLRRFKRFSNNTLKYVVATGIIGGVIVLEYYSPPKHLSFYPGTKETIPVVYQWLAQQSDDLRIIELPVRFAKDDFEYTYYSTFHWKRMVNGRSAFIPNGITQIFREMRTFPSPRTIDLLKSLGIQYVILHTEKIEQRLPSGFPEGINVLQKFDNDMLLEVSSTKTPEVLRNSRSFTPQLTLQYYVPSALRPDEHYMMGLSFQSNTHGPLSPLPHEKATFQIEWTTSTRSVHKEFREVALPIFIQGGEQITLPMQITTPPEPGKYQVIFEAKTPLFDQNSITKQVIISSEALDSRHPGKLQAQFIQVDIPDVWESGKPLPIRILIKNTGDTLWKARVTDRKYPVGEVHLGVVDWQEVSSGNSLKETDQQLFLSRGFLPYDVAPGEEVVIKTEIKTPELVGEFLVQLDMVSELIQWFSEQGSQLFTKKIVLK